MKTVIFYLDVLMTGPYVRCTVTHLLDYANDPVMILANAEAVTGYQDDSAVGDITNKSRNV